MSKIATVLLENPDVIAVGIGALKWVGFGILALLSSLGTFAYWIFKRIFQKMLDSQEKMAKVVGDSLADRLDGFSRDLERQESLLHEIREDHTTCQLGLHEKFADKETTERRLNNHGERIKEAEKSIVRLQN